MSNQPPLSVMEVNVLICCTFFRSKINPTEPFRMVTPEDYTDDIKTLLSFGLIEHFEEIAPRQYIIRLTEDGNRYAEDIEHFLRI